MLSVIKVVRRLSPLGLAFMIAVSAVVGFLFARINATAQLRENSLLCQTSPIIEDRLNRIVQWQQREHSQFPGVAFGGLPDCSDPELLGRPDLDRGSFYRQWMSRLRESTGRPELHGIEIGAQHNPAPLPDFCNVTYVDAASSSDLLAMHPELNGLRITEPHIIDRAETLEKIATKSFWFVISSHLIEHTRDVLTALQNKIRVLRPGGYLFLIIPNMCGTFDRGRLLTSVQHFYSEYRTPEVVSRNEAEHFREWAFSNNHGSILSGKDLSAAEVEKSAKHFRDVNYHIHYHTFTFQSVLDLLFRSRRHILLADVVFFDFSLHQIWCVLRRFDD